MSYLKRFKLILVASIASLLLIGVVISSRNSSSAVSIVDNFLIVKSKLKRQSGGSTIPDSSVDQISELLTLRSKPKVTTIDNVCEEITRRGLDRDQGIEAIFIIFVGGLLDEKKLIQADTRWRMFMSSYGFDDAHLKAINPNNWLWVGPEHERKISVRTIYYPIGSIDSTTSGDWQRNENMGILSFFKE